MASLARLAVGSLEPDVNCRAIVWGLLDVLDRGGLRVQSFFSRGCLQQLEAATVITGIPPRQLDSWLLSAEACRERFLRSARPADFSIVEGSFSDEPGDENGLAGSRLSTLCKWLALPRVGIVEMPSLVQEFYPHRRPPVDAILIDRVTSPCEFFRWQTTLESLWGIPVLGGLDEVPGLRSVISQLQPRWQPPRDLCEKLGSELLRYLRPERMLELASQPPWPCSSMRSCSAASATPACRREVTFDRADNLTVAIAYDDAFFGYSADALDALDELGVTVRDFSPLSDESLPADADIVYIGCGQPDLHAEKLSQNCCLATALRDHVCAGKRIYAEGAGLAYLCQQMALADGRKYPMSGILPAIAHGREQLLPPRPIELTLAGDHWLGLRGRRLRGYLNENWRLEPTGPLVSCAAEPERRLDLVQRHKAMGSRVHFNLALQPAMLESFLRPSPPALAWAVRQA